MEKSKIERINAEKKRIAANYEKLTPKEMSVAAGLIDQAAFMAVTLEDLQTAINENGVTDKYQNGANQYGIKESAELKSYNTTLKNYKAVMDTLIKMLPCEPAPKKNIADELAELKKLNDINEALIIAEFKKASDKGLYTAWELSEFRDDYINDCIREK